MSVKPVFCGDTCKTQVEVIEVISSEKGHLLFGEI